MRVLYLDCFSGISGNMILSALLDLGINIKQFRQELSKLNLQGYDIVASKKNSYGITCMDVQVIVDNEVIGEYSHCMNQQNHNQEHKVKRNIFDIETLIESSKLSEKIKGVSKNVFREIINAQAKVNGKELSEISFDEVRAINLIVYIVGVVICLEMLKIDKIISSPLYEGKGFVECELGKVPLPVPEVMEILSGSDIPIITEDINAQLITPVGIGILKIISSYFGNMPSIQIEEVGYGIAYKDIGRLNALRAVVGSIYDEAILGNDVSNLDANTEDISDQHMGYIM